jgi:hypothetical protein
MLVTYPHVTDVSGEITGKLWIRTIRHNVIRKACLEKRRACGQSGHEYVVLGHPVEGKG